MKQKEAQREVCALPPTLSTTSGQRIQGTTRKARWQDMMIIRTRQAAWTRNEKPEYDSQHQAVEIGRQTSAKVPAYCVGLRCWIGGWFAGRKSWEIIRR